MSLLGYLQRLTRHDPSRFLPFVVAERRVGWITPARARVLAAYPEVFVVVEDRIAMAPGLATPEARTAALGELAGELHASGLFLNPRGEMYAVKNAWGEPEVMRLDRALVPGFGVRAYGVHVNGFVRAATGMSLWIGTRALGNAVEPGKLDNMVAGGQPAGLGLMDNVIKECAEEAGLSEALARTAVASGAIGYRRDVPEGLKDDVLFCFDLELPAQVVPHNRDGELSHFDLMPVDRALGLVATGDRFKFNVGAVIIDFALRHGLLGTSEGAAHDTLRAYLQVH